MPSGLSGQTILEATPCASHHCAITAAGQLATTRDPTILRHSASGHRLTQTAPFWASLHARFRSARLSISSPDPHLLETLPPRHANNNQWRRKQNCLHNPPKSGEANLDRPTDTLTQTYTEREREKKSMKRGRERSEQKLQKQHLICIPHFRRAFGSRKMFVWKFLENIIRPPLNYCHPHYLTET